MTQIQQQQQIPDKSSLCNLSLKTFELLTIKVGGRDMTKNIFLQLPVVHLLDTEKSMPCSFCDGYGFVTEGSEDEGEYTTDCLVCDGSGEDENKYEVIGKVIYPRKIKGCIDYFFDLLLEDKEDECLASCVICTQDFKYKHEIHNKRFEKMQKYYQSAKIQQIFLRA